jgi:hypothetical protein
VADHEAAFTAGVSGIVTVTELSAAFIRGTFSITFLSHDTVTGRFEAPACQATELSATHLLLFPCP